jgi:hypothetical protein
MRALKEALISKDKRDWASTKEKDLYADIRKYYIIFCNNALTKKSILDKFPESEFLISTKKHPNFKLIIIPINIVEKYKKWFENLAKTNHDIISFNKALKESTIKDFIKLMNTKVYFYEIGSLTDNAFDFNYEF